MTATHIDTQTVIIAGIDAHKHTHQVVILDQHGTRLGDHQFPTTTRGYQDLLDWVSSFGLIDRIGIESTGSYAAGLTRYLLKQGLEVIEVNTPHAHTRARKGKNDAIDAEAAARKVLANNETTVPKDTTSTVESIRMLKVSRESAVKHRAQALTQLQDLLITAPASLRETITAKTGHGLASQCTRLRPDPTKLTDPLHAAKLSLRTLARRIAFLDEEIADLDRHLDTLVAQAAPTLINRVGIGTQHAAQLLITAGHNINRLTSEAAFARLCGVAPIPVASGKTHRMRLHRGGDRQANRALHMIAVCRLRYDQRTIDYMTKRTAQGLSKKDTLRCLKRYIAREVFHDLTTDLTTT